LAVCVDARVAAGCAIAAVRTVTLLLPRAVIVKIDPRNGRRWLTSHYVSIAYLSWSSESSLTPAWAWFSSRPACLRHRQVKQKEAAFQKRRLFLYSEGSAARSRESLLVNF